MCLSKERNISLRWSEAVLLGSWFYKHFRPSGTENRIAVCHENFRNSTLGGNLYE